MLIARDPSKVIEEQHRIVQQIAKLARTEFGLTALLDFAHRFDGHKEQIEQKRQSKRAKPRKATTLIEELLRLSPKLTNTFDAQHAIEVLAQDKRPLKQKNIRDAVSKALRKLRDDRKLVEVKKGTGGTNSVYKFA